MAEIVPHTSAHSSTRFPSGADPRLVDEFERISRCTGCTFKPASLTQQQLVDLPGGIESADGAAVFDPPHAVPGLRFCPAIFDRTPAQLRRHDGTPLLCMQARIDDYTALALQAIRLDGPQGTRLSWSMVIVSALGFRPDQVWKVLEANPSPFAMNRVGGPEVSFLTKPYARLVLAPQSTEACIATVNSLLSQSVVPPLDTSTPLTSS